MPLICDILRSAMPGHAVHAVHVRLSPTPSTQHCGSPAARRKQTNRPADCGFGDQTLFKYGASLTLRRPEDSAHAFHLSSAQLSSDPRSRMYDVIIIASKASTRLKAIPDRYFMGEKKPCSSPASSADRHVRLHGRFDQRTKGGRRRVTYGRSE